MNDIEIARIYMENFLPENLKSILDISRMEHTLQSFVSEDLKQTFADIVFRCPFRQDHKKMGYLCLLAEHKGRPYKFTIIQIGGYKFDGYRQQIRNNEDPLIPIIPILYYHGRRKWKPPTTFQLFQETSEVLLPYIPSFEIIFHSLFDLQDEEIYQLGHSLLASAMMTQKYSSDPGKLLERLVEIFSIIQSWDNRNQIQTFFVYFFELVKEEGENVDFYIDKLPDNMKTEVLSYTERMVKKGREEGIEEGMEKGMEKGRRETIQNMLRKNMDLGLICEIMKVSSEYVELIRKDMEI